MARYGSGYNTSITQALSNVELSISVALTKAWDLFCDKLQDDVNELWEYWIAEVYSNDPKYYQRTYQLYDSSGCPFKVVNKAVGVGRITNGVGTVVAGFEADDLGSIGITEISNPPYHIIEQGKGTEDFVNVVGATNSEAVSFIDELKEYLLNSRRWQQLYRDACKEMGLTL